MIHVKTGNSSKNCKKLRWHREDKNDKVTEGGGGGHIRAGGQREMLTSLARISLEHVDGHDYVTFKIKAFTSFHLITSEPPQLSQCSI